MRPLLRPWLLVAALTSAGCDDAPQAPPACTAEPAAGCPGAVPLDSVPGDAPVGSRVCDVGRCLTTCQAGAGCAAGQICTALPGVEGVIGVCVADCSDRDGCPSETPCQPLAVAGPRGCLPPGHGVGSACAAAPDGGDVCGVAGMNARCFAGQCHRACPWVRNRTPADAPCPEGAECALLSGDGGMAACFDGCSGAACPAGTVCEPDGEGAPVCLPEAWSCDDLEANPLSCGACRHACGGLSPCAAGYCGTDADPLVPALSAPAPVARYRHAAARLGPYVYVAGGLDEAGEALARVDRYDVAADAWLPAPPLPEARADFALLAGGDGRLYAVGGLDAAGAPLATVVVLDGDAWTAGPPLSTARSGFQSAVDARGRLYALGGLDAAGATLASAERLAPGDAWAPLPALPTARALGAAARGLDGRLYVLGGAGDDTLDIFDPSADTWAPGAPASPPDGARVTATRPTAALGGDGVIYRLDGLVEKAPGAVPRFGAAPSGGYYPALDAWGTGGHPRLRQGDPLVDGLLWGSAAVTLEDGRIAVFGGSTDPDGGAAPRVETRIMGPRVTLSVSAADQIHVHVEPSRPGGVFAYLDTAEGAPIALPRDGADFEVPRPTDGAPHTLIVIGATTRFRVHKPLP